jgi:hypothetical protein
MSAIDLRNPAVKTLLYWIEERHTISERKQDGKTKPWTKDKILQQYRFCNVYRELDTVTKWVSRNWRTPNQQDPLLWFAMTVARLINWPDTLQEIEYPLAAGRGRGAPAVWDKAHFVNVLHCRKAHGHKVFGGAYIVSTNGHAMDKANYLADYVLAPLWQCRYEAPRPEAGLGALHQWLTQFDGLGSFMAGQVVADVKYAKPYLKVHDWWDFAASGPGSRRGLNRIIGKPIDMPWREPAWHQTLTTLGGVVNMQVERTMPRLHLQDLQNCLCEFDKYMRTQLGEGRPRATYPGR